MQPKAHLFFHLNLAFSSIDKRDWPRVIDKCYWPLLDIISDQNIPLGIEVSGWTLNSILEVSPKWVCEFKRLLDQGKCELIGSGYCQIISPLVPYEVNIQNHKIGLEIYNDLLNVVPKIALVNEMAFSDAVIDLLTEVGYTAFIMDRDNVNLALGGLGKLPTVGKGTGAATLPILWADSILFQKLQHLSHGNISMDDYLAFIAVKISEGRELLPVYSNDAETFDFRPGRFAEEGVSNPEGEWLRIRDALQNLRDKLNLDFILPSAALEVQTSSSRPVCTSLTSAAYPVVVKKQPKYNIARWAVTGRDDTWLNTMCFRIYEKLTTSSQENVEKWKNLCELWSSDLRTHLTEQRWSEAKSKVKETLAVENITDRYGISLNKPVKSYGDAEEMLGSFQRRYTGDGVYVELKNQHVCVLLNLRRGITIEKLEFASHGFESCIGRIPHGFHEVISEGFDYYSGGVIVDLPKSLSKLTDLKPVSPEYYVSTNGALSIKAEIATPSGEIVKVVEISSLSESIRCIYQFNGIKRDVGSVRVGNFTLSPKFSDAFESYAFHSGGHNPSVYQVQRPFEQSNAASRYVSSSRGFLATAGKVNLNFGAHSLDVTWDNALCAPLCLVDHSEVKTRLSFSICEYDETSRESDRLGELCLKLSPGTLNGK